MHQRMTACKNRRERGMTLLELAVAVLVLSIGTLAAVRGTDQARLEIGAAPDRALAGIVAHNRAAELRLHGPFHPLPEQVEMAGRRFAITQTRTTTASGLIQIEIAVRPSGQTGGAGALLVSHLPPRPGPGG